MITNRDEVVTIAEEFYSDLYSSRDNQDKSEWGCSLEEADIPLVLREEVYNALKEMQAGKAAGEDKITADILKDGGQIKPVYAMLNECEHTGSLEDCEHYPNP